MKRVPRALAGLRRELRSIYRAHARDVRIPPRRPAKAGRHK
jgi:hypothetical protein